MPTVNATLLKANHTINLPTSTAMDTNTEVIWIITKAQNFKLTITLPAILNVTPTPLPVDETITSDPYEVRRTIDDPRHSSILNKPDPYSASYQLTIKDPVLTTAPESTGTSTLVIERGVEPIGEGVWPHHPHQNKPIGASPGVAGTPGPSRGEQRPEP